MESNSEASSYSSSVTSDASSEVSIWSVYLLLLLMTLDLIKKVTTRQRYTHLCTSLRLLAIVTLIRNKIVILVKMYLPGC